MQGSVKITVLENWPTGVEREKLRTAWSGLLERSESPTVFQTFEWNESWWTVFGRGHELELALVHVGEELVAIAPLMIERGRSWGIPFRKLAFIGTANASSDYSDFVVSRAHPGALPAILKWIKSRSDRFTSLDLRNLRSTSPTLSALALFPHARMRVSSVAPAWMLGDRDADRALLSKKSVKRKLNWYQKNGRIEYKRVGDEAFESFFDQHVARWDGTGTPSLFLDPAQRRFYRELGASLEPTGYLHFSGVFFDDRPIAYHFGFEFRGTLIWYKPTYDPAQSRNSPGEVLIRYLFDDAITRDLKEVDFTVGNEAFKFRFSNVVREVHRARVHNRAFERAMAWALESLKDRLKRSRIAGLFAEAKHRVPSA